MRWVVLIFALIAYSESKPSLKEITWMRLPDGNGEYVPFRDTADRIAWDDREEFLYVIGTTTETLHIIDFLDHNNPVLVHTRKFDQVLDGDPTAIALCRNGNFEELVIAFKNKDRLGIGHIEIFRPWHRFDQNLPLLSRTATETDPSAVKFEDTCAHFVVLCEGHPGKRGNTLEDPVFHIDVFEPEVNGWRKIPVNFGNARGLNLARYIYRDTSITGHSILHDLEPTDLVIDDSDVYVTFQKNNVFAHFDIRDLVAGVDFYDMTSKNWNNYDIDTSDQDGAIAPDRVNMVRRDVRSFLQAKRVDSVVFQGQTYIVSANTGGIKNYRDAEGQEGVDFSEAVRGHSIDPATLGPNIDAETVRQLGDDTALGRLFISTQQIATDGWDNIFGWFDHLYAYGGRSWSIWSTSLNEIWDSRDDLEYQVSQHSRNVFNGDCFGLSNSPPQHLDSRSDDMGVEPASIAAGVFNNTPIVAIGSGRMGGIWMYTVEEGEAPGLPEGVFREYTRVGNVNGNWENLYNNSDAGVQYINDLLFVDHRNHLMLVAIGTQMGAIQIFEVEDDGTPWR